MIGVGGPGGGGGGVSWLIALVPTGSLAIAFVTAWAATYPQRRDRRLQTVARQEREQRLDAAADVVLGRDADPNRGLVARVPGLAEKVTEHGKQIREVNQKIGTTKDGRPLAQVLEEAISAVRTVGVAQREQAETIEAQQQTLAGQSRQVEGHERRLGRQDERLNQHEVELRELWRTGGGKPSPPAGGSRT